MYDLILLLVLIFVRLELKFKVNSLYSFGCK